MKTPEFWKTSLEWLDEAWEKAEKATEKRVLTESAGGRPVRMLAYGPKKVKGKANYSSALGAHDITCYKNPVNDYPTIVIIGAEHGQEVEGTAAVNNLISLMETGYDLAGNPNEELVALAGKVRLVLVPIANPDGRARFEKDGIPGLTGKELRYWGQGTWKDGSLCGWPDCKKIHPIKEQAGFLGAYFNDDGINLMHDNFFHPMAKETQALLDLCGEEQADYILHLHGGSNDKGSLLQTAYAPPDVNRAIEALWEGCCRMGAAEGLEFGLADRVVAAGVDQRFSFNLVSAAHHVSGGVSACYESNEHLTDEPGAHRTHAEIVRMHMILFEECLRQALSEEK